MKVLDFGLAKALEGSGTAPGTRFGRGGHPHRRVGDAGRDRHGHGRLHEPRAGERLAGGQALRHLVVRRGAVRDAGRPPAVRGRDDVAHDGRRAARRHRLDPVAGLDARAHPQAARALPRARSQAPAAGDRRGADHHRGLPGQRLPLGQPQRRRSGAAQRAGSRRPRLPWIVAAVAIVALLGGARDCSGAMRGARRGSLRAARRHEDLGRAAVHRRRLEHRAVAGWRRGWSTSRAPRSHSNSTSAPSISSTARSSRKATRARRRPTSRSSRPTASGSATSRPPRCARCRSPAARR